MVAPNMTAKLTATVHSGDGGGTVAFTQAGTPLAGCGAVPLVYASKGWRAVCKVSWPQTGSYNIVANYAGDGYSEPSSVAATVTVKPVPVVASVSPNAGATGGGGAITVTGSNFTGATNVSFGSVPASKVTVVSSSELTATVPAHVAGTVNVSVTTPVGKSPNSSGGRYTYDAPPMVSAISPSSGAKGTVITLTGTGFVTGTKVTFGTASATKVVRVSSTELEATAPAGAGTLSVTVTNPGGTSAPTSADQFTYSS
jgi:hypothetical protein